MMTILFATYRQKMGIAIALNVTASLIGNSSITLQTAITVSLSVLQTKAGGTAWGYKLASEGKPKKMRHVPLGLLSQFVLQPFVQHEIRVCAPLWCLEKHEVHFLSCFSFFREPGPTNGTGTLWNKSKCVAREDTAAEGTSRTATVCLGHWLICDSVQVTQSQRWRSKTTV